MRKTIGRRALIITLIAALLCIAVAVGIVLIREARLSGEQSELLSELDSRAGEYDDSSIVLRATSKAKAEKLAERFGARLRITSDGKYATLTLPEGVSIRDICADKENRAYLSQITPDYKANISDIDEISEKYVRPTTTPNYSISDDGYDLQNYLRYLNIGDAWHHYRGDGVTVAVIDTGIDTDHPEFAGRISEYSYNATYDKIVKDYTAADGGYDWSLVEDVVGHGTAVTGVIAAAMDGQGTVGIAPQVNIIVIKAECDANGRFLRGSDLVFGLYYAIERDVDVVNMSFGGGGDFSAPVRLGVDSDILMVAAAGNDSTSSPQQPASCEGVIGVGALEADGWNLASYSNFGENTNLVAPGTVYTAAAGGGYRTMNGTSFSSPIVAAALALMKSNGEYKYSSNEVLEEILYASCYDLGDLGPDFYYGYGALDISALLLEEKGTVTFNMLTDELENTTQVFVRSHTLQNMPEPERLYAVFDGWYYDIHCTEEYNWYEDEFNSDITLYANWVNEDDGVPFTYVTLDDGTIEIRSYTGKRRYITVPEEIEGKAVSSIGEFAFEGETRLREVRLPSRLRRIRTGAFAGCTNLYKIDIPASVTEIGASAFSNAVCLGTLAIPADSNLISIGDNAFANCTKLRRVDLPASLKSVNGSAFIGTTSNMEINVAPKNKHFVSIDGVLFNYTKSMIVAYPAGRTAAYTVPENVRYIGSCAFAYTKASLVDLGSVTEIGGSAFAASSLSAVVIPDTVISMGEYAFQSSAYLSSVKICNGLRSISKEAFEYCSNLSEITIPAGIESIGGAAFKSAGLGKLIFENNSKLTVISYEAFFGCPLTSVNFPDSLMNIGDSAFSECFSLSSISFGEGSSLQSIGAAAFRYAPLATVAFPANIRTIGDYAFADTAIAGSVTIPASLESLGGGAFGACHALTEIKVESGNKIYADIDGVVYTNDGKTAVAYPAGNPAENYTVLDGTQKIGVAAFYGSWNLRGVTVPAGVDEFYEYAFFDCEKVCGYSLPDTLETVGPYSMAKNYSLSSVSLPDSVINIGRYAFAYDSSLYTVYISDTSKLARISFASFALSGIQTMRIPANVSTVAQYAFEGCKQLTSVTFAAGSKLQSISAYFFLGCDSIQNITFENGSALTSIQAHGLEGMKNLTSIDFGDARLTNIDNYAFRYCSSLATLNLPDTLINIGRFAFYKCTALSSLTVPETIEHIGSYAFHGTDNCALYFSGAELPFYLDENWDDGLSGYYVGVSQTVESGDWKYAILKNGKTAILEYLGNEKNIDLRTLNIGEISTIGGYAFYGKNLESIILPESLTQIQRYAFAENTALAGITIPANVKYIAKYAFHNTGIMNLTFTGSNVSVIEQYAFAYTRKLTSVTLPAGIVKLGTYVFYRSGIESVVFAAGTTLTEIPEGAFSGTKLAEVTIPDSVTLVNHNAFRDCTALCRLTLGAGENLRLMSNVFYNTSLAAVHIPANVEYIGEYCFVGLRSLSAFTVDAANPYYTALGGLLYSKDERKIIAAPAGITGTLYVPKSTEVIGFGAFENSLADSIVFDSASNILSFGYRAFYGAKNLREVTVPATVVAIDYYAFAQCSNLETVKFEEGSRLAGIYEGAFFGCGKLKNIILADNIVEISDYAFYGCTSLTEIPVSDTSMIKGIYSYAFAYSGICGDFATPKTLIDIGDYAFRGTKITSAFIPDDNKLDLIIGIGVFEECEVMEKIDVPFLGASYGDEDIYWIGYIFGAGAPSANATYIPQSLRTYIAHEGGNARTNAAYIKAAETKIEKITLPEGITEIGDSAFSGCGSLSSITIPDGVTSIGDYAFSGCGSLSSITIPDGVMSMGRSTFYNCSSLIDVEIPDSVTGIGEWAFYRCSNLTSITIPDGVTSIGNRAFSGCGSLVSITIPDSVTSIGDYAFYNCKSLTSIRIPDGVTVIGNYTFSSCESLTNITIPNGVTSIGDETFYGCNNLASITMPYGVTSIGNAAFQYCYSLTSITIPSSVTNIGNNAFYFCYNLYVICNNSDLKFNIGSDSYGSIAKYAFMIYNNDGSIIYKENENGIPYYITSDGFVFKSENGEYILIKYIGSEETITLPLTADGNDYTVKMKDIGDAKNVIIPSGITQINDNAFKNCQNLTSITISDGVTSIGDSAFYGCNNLTNITIPDSVTSIGGFAFSDCSSLKDVKLSNSITAIASFLFERSGITSITIPDSVTSIDNGAFYACELLEEIVVSVGNPYYKSAGNCIIDKNGTLVAGCGKSVIPDDGSVTRIGYQAFYGCGNIANITIPNSVTSIGARAFSGCSSVTNITIPDSVTSIEWEVFDASTHVEVDPNNPVIKDCGGAIFEGTALLHVNRDVESVTIPDGVTSIDDRVFSGCTNLTSITIPDSVTSIGNGAFYNCTSLTSITIPNSVTSIGGGAFHGCASLTSITIQNGITSIEYNAFEGCTNLTSITIPDSVTSIGGYAFYGCSSLTSITIPESVTSIGESAFSGCTSLTNITIPDGVTSIGNRAFSDCTSLINITIPESVTSIGGSVFSDCSSLTSITMPESVTSIGYGAFSGCSSLTSITIPDSVTSIDGYAFSGCTSLTNITIPDGVTSIGSSAFYGCTSLANIAISDGVTSIGSDTFDKTAYYNNSSNWDNGALYIGNLLIKVDKDVERFAARNDTICIANDAFEECYKLRHIEVGGGYYEIFRKDYTTSNLETLVITDLPRDFNVYNYFGTSNIPLTLKTIILKSGVDVSNPHLFDNITGVTIYVEDAKIDCPWDYGCPGWNNGNKVFYGDEWARVKFSSDGEVIADGAYRSGQVIRPPYIADVKNEDTNRIFVGWDFDGDGQADSLPATVLGEVEANAVYRTEDATYTIEFLDKNGDVLYTYILPYGATVPEPTAPVAAGYVFLGWDGYYAGMSATADMKIASSWSHIGGGHDYVITVILPTCTAKGYTKHECSICGDSYMTDITEETGHSFGDWIISTKPTCSDDGIKYRVCHCGYMETDVAQSTGHSYEILSEIKATCKSGGYITYKCSSCGETMTEETNMLPHNYEKKYVSKSFLQWLIEHILNILFGYEGNNAYYYKCTVCGKIADVDDSAVIRTASAQEICEHEAGDWTVDSQYAHMEVRKCVKCDKIIESRNECRHNYVGSSWEAFGNSKIALSCRDCGELDIEDSLDAGKMTHTCTVNNNLTLNYYYAGAELLKEFDSFYLRVEKTCYNTDGSTYIRTTILYGDDNGGRYKFRYNDILSYEVGDEIRATLVAVKNGVETERKADIYNIKTYAYNNLAKENVAAKSKTLLANMLNYCAQSQIYFNYRTDALVNAELTDEQRALYVIDSCEATVSNKGVKTTLDGATASVISRTLVLTSSIELKFYMNLRNYKNSDNIYDLSGISVKIEYTDMEGKLVNTVIDSSEFGYDASNDRYSVRFAKLRATELRSVVEITILKDGKAISNTETYSVESFAHSQLTSASAKENTKELLKRMIIYSDCAVKYFE